MIILYSLIITATIFIVAALVGNYITDKLKNCYSQKDDVLRILYGLCMMKTAIGRNELILCDENNKNLVENYNFTQYNYGHLSYNMGVVAKDISGYYKEL